MSEHSRLTFTCCTTGFDQARHMEIRQSSSFKSKMQRKLVPLLILVVSLNVVCIIFQAFLTLVYETRDRNVLIMADNFYALNQRRDSFRFDRILPLERERVKHGVILKEENSSSLNVTVYKLASVGNGKRLRFHRSRIGPLFILNVVAGNQSEHAKWDIFKLYGVINITYFPNYSATTRCCFLFNSDKGQQIIEMTPLNLTKFWSISLLRNFHVTCPNPKHSQGMVPTGVALKILDIPCSSGYITYLVPFYPRKEPGTTLALGTKIAHGNISAELLIEWMETYKFLGVDKVVTYYVDDLEPSALKVLQYYASEGSFLDLHFYIPAATDKLQRIFHPPNPQKWNENNLAAKDQFERMSGYTYFGIIDHDEFLVPSRNRSLKHMLADLFKRYNGTAGFAFGSVHFPLSWAETGKVQDLIIDRYIRRTELPLEFAFQKNIYQPSMVFSGSLNTHHISPKELVQRAPRDEGYLRHYRPCNSNPRVFCQEMFKRITDTDMAEWAKNIRDRVHFVRKQVFGNESFVIS